MKLFVLVFLNLNLVSTWYKFETTHFVIHFQDQLLDVAKKSAWILENISYPTAKKFLQAEPSDKVHVVIIDTDDVGNGFAIEIFNQIVIWTADIYYIPLRGRHPWLGNVLTHELAHIVSLRKTKKTSKFIPFFGLALGFFCPIPSRLCQFDTLEGRTTLAGYTGFGFISNSEPAYFTEGIAQLVTREAGFDDLDSYRDMFLRTMLYHNKTPSFDDVANFIWKRGWEGEIVYNHGFSFLVFITERYGWDVLRAVMEDASGPFTFSFESLFEKHTGKKSGELEREWKEWMWERYKAQIERWEKWKEKPYTLKLESPREYSVFRREKKVYFSTFPKFFPPSSPYWFAVIRDGTLWIYFKPKKFEGKIPSPSFQKKITGFPVLSRVQSFDISPDGKKIIVARWITTEKFIFFHSIPQTYGDLYIVELKKKPKKFKVKRLTHGARASFPVFLDDKKVLYIRTEKLSRNLMLYELEKKRSFRITSFENGEQITFPSVSPSREKLAFAFWDDRKQDIALLEISKIIKNPEELKPITDTTDFIFLTKDEAEDRDIVFLTDSLLLYTSDADGVFNVWALDLKTGNKTKLTDELSGALFLDAITWQSEAYLLWSSFSPDGFQIRATQISLEKIKMKLSTEVASKKAFGVEFTSEEQKSKYPAIPEKLSSPSTLRADTLSLSDPILIPTISLTANPIFLTFSQNIFFLSDIATINFTLTSFDRVGRMFLDLSGFLGIRGSWFVSGRTALFTSENIIPQLILFSGNANVRSFLEGTLLDWRVFEIGGVGAVIFPFRVIKQPRFTPVIFVDGILWSLDLSVQTISPTQLSLTSLARSFGIGTVLPISATFFRKLGISQVLSVRAFSTTVLQAPFEDVSESFSLESFTSLSFALPSLGEKQDGLLFLNIALGWIPTDATGLDSFWAFHPGYFVYFNGDVYFDGAFGLGQRLWGGSLKILPTYFLHSVDFGTFFSAFRYVDRLDFENAESVLISSFKKPCDEEGLLCEVGAFIGFSFSIFYRYSSVFYVLVAKGLQDPLKAPVRIYGAITFAY